MKCVILAGGLGTRIMEESVTRPKPMVEIGGLPILWHIMKTYAHHGITEFIVCLGYKGYVVKEFFANYFLHSSDVTFDFATNGVIYHASRQEPWKVTLVDTGISTNTGGRLKAIQPFLEPGKPFCMTYGDGVADIDIASELAFHENHRLKATVACVRPPPRFGRLVMEDHLVTAFEEKPMSESGLINGGFFILQPDVIDYIANADTAWEREPMETLSREGQLAGFVHEGFWQPMDTLRESQLLNRLWSTGQAPWKVWND